MNSSSIFSSRVSRSSSRNRPRSFTVSGGSSPACSRRYMPTQLPRVPSFIPSSFATLAIGRDVSITIFTASSLNSGEKLFFGRDKTSPFQIVHPNGWTVRKARGTPRASDEEIVGLLRACLSARDRLIVLLMVRAGLRRGELCGLRRSDVHLLADSRPLGCEIARAHLHVVRRDDNPNGAWAKSRRPRAVPLDFLTVLAFDTYALERMTVSGAAGSDFVVVNLFRGRVGAPMRPGAIGDQ